MIPKISSNRITGHNKEMGRDNIAETADETS